MKITQTFAIFFLCCAFLLNSPQMFALQETNVLEPQAQAIDWVWSGQRVWFDFISQDEHQLVAYYDAARQMSVAVRQVGDVNGAPWIYHKLPSFLGWDAHNSITTAFDENGHIHVVGNLHANPLVYFRSSKPYDPRTLKQVDVMIARETEQHMTYPKFFLGNNNELFFKYRLGTSSQAQWYYIRWNASKNSWEAIHDSTLLDGEGTRSVYPKGPVFGPDGYAHLSYVWRESPIASSNHDLSYAKSKDLINWESSTGKKIALPIVLAAGEIIDPIPMHGGLLNGRTPIGFDAENRVVVTYQKYDENGDTQVFLLRQEGSNWKGKQISSWKNSRVDLDKSGALDLPIDTSQPAFTNSAGNIIVPASYKGVAWQWEVEHNTLNVISGAPVEQNLPESIQKYDLDNGIPLRVLPLIEQQKTPSSKYFISWEAMQPNRDQARADIPLPSTLRVHHID
ncbi:BNR repeat-containing protein [Glaciecola sp. SC05]|uniref:BNR repeat-containing protein n=1 Tax=Glaciecola sp. SC05 TaxID=1987355 RepID=UPI0035276155